MNQKEKMALIEEALDTEEGALVPDTILSDLDEWDSIAALSLIAMLDEQFDKTISGAEIKAMKTVEDILAHMN
ncbi:acyl carrier protein [Acutalibacter sp. 1XD8-36]|jgi:acyl carrier protein|uniref:acyl carrier protein n=1 Tax=Acutalibacter sp. 1XD8-36 TaxID=2320852 RepID=UPI0014130382|nr:acyl carrier protein [Acutalibacter sp. 1XD8-36]NBJ90826.1 acyl carrier protein [Acutalibacter sp. 1XD8-36]